MRSTASCSGITISRAFISASSCRTADDEAFTKNVQTWFNNDAANKAKQGAGKNLHYVETYEGKLVDCKGIVARYVRLYSAGNNANELNDYIEVKVFGKAK